MAWYDEAIFYHIYPLGMTGAPKQNEYGEPVERLNKLLPWISHIKNIDSGAKNTSGEGKNSSGAEGIVHFAKNAVIYVFYIIPRKSVDDAGFLECVGSLKRTNGCLGFWTKASVVSWLGYRRNE